MKTRILAIASGIVLFGSALIAAPADANLSFEPRTYTVVCSFDDGTSWWGSTQNHVTATRMVSRCEGLHGGKASFYVGFDPGEE